MSNERRAGGGFDKVIRQYKYRGGTTSAEQKRFWILLIIALGIAAAIIFW